MSKHKVGILGYGIIGKGVFKLIGELPSSYQTSVKKVFDLPFRKEELGDLLVTDFKDITEDEEIDIVVEVLGGDELPYQAITSALKNKKSVITSNKETVSKHLDEYLNLAKENGVFFLFEAAVGGGIPLLNPIIQISKFDKIKSFKGILNGTTNFILTKVIKEGMSFDYALKEAQRLGFAERDPSADLEGADLARKGTIVASIAFNKKIDYKDIPCFGIKNINDKIIEDIKNLNKIIKFIVEGKVIDDDRIELLVTPVLLDVSHTLSQVTYEFNGAIIDCEYNSKLTFIGKGAGSLPTASAVMQNLVSIIEHNGNINRENAKDAQVIFVDSYEYFVSDGVNSKIISPKNINDLQKYSFVAKIL